MDRPMQSFSGGCHCGAISLEFATAQKPSDVPVRECQCSFCRKHASRAITDPAGSVMITIHAPDYALPYRFGFECADYYVCRRCGVYVAAVTRSDQPKAIAILNALDERAKFTASPVATDYDDETQDQRQARRAAGWTPVQVAFDRSLE